MRSRQLHKAYEFGTTAAVDPTNLWIYDFQSKLLHPLQEQRRAFKLGLTRAQRGAQ